MYTLFTKKMQHFTLSCFVTRSLIMQVKCGRTHFNKHSEYSTMRWRKYNFMSMDVEVGRLLTFLASMKAKERLYQNYISVFHLFFIFYAWKFTFVKYLFSKHPFKLLDTKVVGITGNPHWIPLDICKQTPYLVGNWGFKVKTTSCKCCPSEIIISKLYACVTAKFTCKIYSSTCLNN